MAKKFTSLNIFFFSLLLPGFIIIQYSWVQSLQKHKLEECKSRIVSGITSAGEEIPVTGRLHALMDTAIANLLHRAFSSRGLGNIPFEFSISADNHHLASRGFHQSSVNNSGHLVLYYALQQNEASNNLLTVVVPFWEKWALKEMTWIITALVFLTAMLLAIFCCAYILIGRKQHQFYDNRTKAINNMMGQLATPLSTVSVAAEALLHATAMHDSVKMNYYRKVIHEENERINKHVQKFMQDLE